MLKKHNEVTGIFGIDRNPRLTFRGRGHKMKESGTGYGLNHAMKDIKGRSHTWFGDKYAYEQGVRLLQISARSLKLGPLNICTLYKIFSTARNVFLYGTHIHVS